MMSTIDFDARVHDIEREAAKLRNNADAYTDRELAKLFQGSGWTQQAIADHMGMSVGWVNQQLRFGAFLKFFTTGENSEFAIDSLTERKFRKHWTRVGKGNTKKKDLPRIAA